MSVQPQYAALPLSPHVNFSTANTNRDGTGTIATLLTARAPGTRVERVNIKATGTTTAGIVRIFKRDNGLTFNADGSVASYSAGTWRLIGEVAVTAITPSGTVTSFEGSFAPTNGLNLGPFEQLGVSTHNAETFNAWAQGAHL